MGSKIGTNYRKQAANQKKLTITGKKVTNLNWDFIMKYLPLYQKAAVLTVKIGLAGIFFAVLIGLFCTAVQDFRVPVLRQAAKVYIEISRNTPLLIQLFFIYYGLPKIGIRTNAEFCGIAGLAFLGGSYMAEAFRSGVEAVETIQRLQPGTYQMADAALCSLSAGNNHQYAGIYGQRHFPFERDQRFFRDQSDGPDVYGKGPDRSVLSDGGKPVPAGGVLSYDPASGIACREPAGKEAPPCRIWDLRSF